MRLIDADVLVEGRVENDPVVIAAKCAPTAYDPDKVVEQQEKSYATMMMYEVAYLVDDLLEIVKGGGVDGN